MLQQDATIGEFLRRFPPDVGAVAVNRVVFGSDGQDRYRPWPVTERFRDALPKGASWNRVIKSMGRRQQLAGTGIHRADPGQHRYVMPSGAAVEFEDAMRAKAADTGIACLHHYMVKSLEEYEEKLARGNANAQYANGRRRRLDRKFSAINAGGARNDDVSRWTAPMRREAMRLRDLLLAQGISYPVWPFIEAKAP